MTTENKQNIDIAENNLDIERGSGLPFRHVLIDSKSEVPIQQRQ